MTITSFLIAALHRGRHAVLAMMVLCAFAMLAQPASAQAVPPVSGELAGSDEYQAKIPAQLDKNRASADCKTAFENGQQQLLMTMLARNEAFYKYSVSAAYAAQCTNKMLDYGRKIIAAISKMGQMAGATDVLTAAMELVITQVLDAVLENLINQLNNEICAVTNELLSFAKSVEHNALCLPTGKLGGFNFSPLNLNLPTESCNGIAINPLGLINLANGTTQADLYTSSGLSLAGSALDPSTAIGGSVGTALMGSTVSGFGSYSTGSMGNTPKFRLDDSYFDSQEYDPLTAPTAVNSGGGANNGATCGNGNFWNFMNALSGSECASGSSCINQYGYLGKWQMGCIALREAGFVSGCSTSAEYKSYDWTAKANAAGVNSYQDYLNSLAAQQQAAGTFEKANWGYLDDSSKAAAKANTQITYAVYQKVNGTCVQSGTKTVTLTESGLLAAGHLVGHGGADACVRQVLKGGICTQHDANCTTPGTYMSRYAGYDISDISGDSCK